MRNLFFLLLAVFAGTLSVFAQVGIGTTNPHPSAELDITSPDNDKGLLPPRLTSVQRNAINSPAPGLMIYNLTTNCIEQFTGIGWKNLCDDGLSSSQNIALCDNYIDPNINTNAPLIIMKYDYDGDGTAEFNWCSREIGIDIDNADGDNNLRTGVDQIWLDRNLGAFRRAYNYDDHLAYGDLYQWGRPMDGHQKINWINSTSTDGSEQLKETLTQSASNTPGNSNFILVQHLPFDWRIGNNNHRWEAINGAGDFRGPCPKGFHVPTESEISVLSNSFSNAYDAFDAIALTLPGLRSDVTGNISGIGQFANYWSSTADGTGSVSLGIDNIMIGTNIYTGNRANGCSIRCIKD